MPSFPLPILLLGGGLTSILMGAPAAAAAAYLTPSLSLRCHDGCATRHAFTVLASSSRAHTATFVFNATGSLPTTVRVNGIVLPPTPPLHSITLPLRRGPNVVEVSLPPALALLSLTVDGAAPTPPYGASLPFVELEAEEATLSAGGAFIIGPSTTFLDLAAEASARRAVALTTPGAYVEFTIPSGSEPISALSIRASIPDAEGGGGIETPLDITDGDGVPLATVTLTSHFSWMYGAYPFTRNPLDGRAHHFFDEVDVRLPTPLAAGSRVRLVRPAPPATIAALPTCAPTPPPPSSRVDCGYDGIDETTCVSARGCCWTVVSPNPTHIPYCYHPVPPPPPPPTPGNVTITLDLLDLWAVDPPTPQPPGSLSVVAAGADPTGVRDASAAFVSTLALAAQNGTVVWVPPGTFLVTQRLLLDNVTLIGAGVWHSLLRGDGAGLMGAPPPHPSVNVRVHDLSIIGNVRVRNDSSPLVGVGGGFSDSILANLRISHQKCGMWLNGPFDRLLISGVDIRDTMADGVNLHGGVSDSTIEHAFLRNLGDDGLASWSDARGAAGVANSDKRGGAGVGGGDAPLHMVPNSGNTFQSNTVVLPILANHYALYGGGSNAILNNEARDSVTEGGGYHVGNRFTSVPTSGTIDIKDNVAIRAGCVANDYPSDLGALWFFALESPLTGATIRVDGNVLVNSTRSAIVFVGTDAHAISGVAITNTTIDGTVAFAFELVATAGHADVSGVVASRIGASAGVNNCSVPLTFTLGGGNVGWEGEACEPRGGVEGLGGPVAVGAHTPMPTHAHTARAASPYELVLLDLRRYPLATCIDGSPGGMYIQRGDPARFIIHMQGGGWCANVEACAARSKMYYGSSTSWGAGHCPDPLSPVCWGDNVDDAGPGGMSSSNSSISPLWADATHVFFAYCDGGSFSGALVNPYVVNASTALHFRGRFILDALLEELHTSFGLGAGTHEVLLKGCSAGGLAVYLHADRVGALIRSWAPGVRYQAAPGAGMFLDVAPFQGDDEWTPGVAWVYRTMNVSGSINDACEAAHRANGDTERCFFAPVTLPFIETSLFLSNSLVDSCAALFIMNLGCSPLVPGNCSTAAIAYIASYRQAMLDAVLPVLHANGAHGAFLQSCWTHIVEDDTVSWLHTLVAGRSQAETFASWWRGDAHAVVYDDAWASNPTCHNEGACN